MLATDKKVYSLRSCSHIRTGNGNDFEPRNGRKWRDKVWDSEKANVNYSEKIKSASNIQMWSKCITILSNIFHMKLNE